MTWPLTARAFLSRIPWQAYVGLALLIAGVIFGATQCAPDLDDAGAQIKVGTDANEALGDAAKEAIKALDDQRVTDEAIDKAIEETKTEIDNAQDADAVRAAVISGLCGRPAHRNDPSCAMQPTDR